MALAGFTSGIILALVAIYIGLESLDKVVNPPDIQFTEAIAVASFGLLVNIACAYILGIEGTITTMNMTMSTTTSMTMSTAMTMSTTMIKNQRGTWDVALNTYKEDFDKVKSVSTAMLLQLTR